MASILQLLIQSKPYLAIYFHPGAGAADDPRVDPEDPLSAGGPAPMSRSFRLQPARSSGTVVTITEAGTDREQALNSRYDPARDAARMLEIDLRPTDIVLLLGLGNPAVLEQIVGRLGEKQICLAIDAHFELGRLLCDADPGTWKFLARPGCHLFAGPRLLPSLRSYIEGLPAERLSGLRVIQHASSRRLAPDYYDRVEQEIRDIIKSKMSDLLTRFEFEQLWLKNILINSRYLPPAGTPGAAATLTPFPGALAGRPGLLVSAGPSLRESLDTIRRLQERAFVLACDTALKPLLTAGIRPHAVITLDAQRHTLFALQGADLSETLVFADLVTNPTVLRCVAGHARALIFSTTARVSYEADGTISRESTPGTAHAENVHGPVGYIQSGGSVATSGFDLLRTLGCDPIMLIGQDLAYTGRRIHTSGTHHQERWVPGVHRTRSLEHIVESVVRRRKTHPVPAIRRGVPQNLEPEAADQSATQLGDYVLNLYRLWFEQSIPSVSNRVANLTHAGAHIAGAEHPADVEAFVETLPKIDDPRAAFAHAGRPRVYRHPLNNRLYRDLKDTLARTDAATDPIAEFLECYDYLRPLLRRSEVYVKRNRERLGEERARQLARRNTLEALQSLERSLRPYFTAPDPR